MVSIVVLCLAVNVIFADLKRSHTLKKSSKTLKRRMNSAFRINCIIPDVIDSVPHNILKVIIETLIFFRISIVNRSHQIKG